MRRILVVFIVAFILQGCAGGRHMVPAYVDFDMKLENGKSAIIFIRPLNSNRSAPIAEYKNKDVVYVGNSTGYSNMLHMTTAGKHEYVLGHGQGAILQADLKPGKFYYVYILPDGNSYNKLTFIPYEHGKDKRTFALASGIINDKSVSLHSRGKWQRNAQEGYIWFENNKASFIAKYNSALQTKNIIKLTGDMGVDNLIR